MYRHLLILLLFYAPVALEAAGNANVLISTEAPQKPLRIVDVHNQMNRILQLHPTQNAMTGHIMALGLANYIDQFDPHHVYLTAEDVRPFLGLDDKSLQVLVEAYYKEDYSAFQKLNSVIQTAIQRMRAFRKTLTLTDKELVKFVKEPLPDISPKAKLEINSFAQNQKELVARATVYIAGLVAQEIEHMLLLKQPGTLSEAMKAVVYTLETPEDDYLYVDKQGVNLSPEQKEALFTYHIIQAFAASLDVHTQVLNPRQAQNMALSLEKEYVGVGLNIDQEGSSFVVSGLIKGGSAESSGKINVGDTILSINDHSLEGMGADEMLSLLRGGVASNVTGSNVILALKNRDTGTYTVSLPRKLMVVEEGRVDSSFKAAQGGIIAILQLHGFYQGMDVSTERDVRKALDELKKNGPIRGLVLDLRDNRGGTLTQAVDVAGLFMKSGVVVVAKDNFSKLHFFRHLSPFVFYNGPIVILTSRETASAAEILAESLKDYGLAVIVGDSQTFGKGSLQLEMLDKSGHASTKVTVGRYYSVSGKSSQIEGVKADIIVPSGLSRSTAREAESPSVLVQDSIEPSYNDTLLDVPRQNRAWFQKFYQPYLQQKIDIYRKWIPELAKLSEERMAKNERYQNLLQGNLEVVTGEGSAQKKVTITQAEANKLLSEMQMQEAVAITKDLARLSDHHTVKIEPSK